MSKITAKDLKEMVKELPKIQTIQFNEFSIDVKQHLSILEKVKLISSIYQSAIDEDDTLQIINYNSLNIAYKVLVAKEYSDISLPKDTIQAYDLLIKSNLYNKIYDAIPLEERLELENAFDSYIDEKKERYERENALPNIVKNILSGFIEKLPSLDEAKKFIEDASKEISNFNPEKMEFVKSFMEMNKGENNG